MSKIKLEETKDRRRLHIGSFFADLNESDYQELTKIFSQQSTEKLLEAVISNKAGKCTHFGVECGGAISLAVCVVCDETLQALG